MAFFRNFKKSFEELKSIRCLTVTALLIGVSVALKFVMIMPSETLKISFAFVGLAAIGMLYGPVVAGLAGVVTDVIGFLVKPTGAFSPIFTLVEVAGAVIYGIFLYGLKPGAVAFHERPSRDSGGIQHRELRHRFFQQSDSAHPVEFHLHHRGGHGHQHPADHQRRLCADSAGSDV